MVLCLEMNLTSVDRSCLLLEQSSLTYSGLIKDAEFTGGDSKIYWTSAPLDSHLEPSPLSLHEIIKGTTACV